MSPVALSDAVSTPLDGQVVLNVYPEVPLDRQTAVQCSVCDTWFGLPTIDLEADTEYVDRTNRERRRAWQSQKSKSGDATLPAPAKEPYKEWLCSVPCLGVLAGDADPAVAEEKARKRKEAAARAVETRRLNLATLGASARSLRMNGSGTGPEETT